MLWLDTCHNKCISYNEHNEIGYSIYCSSNYVKLMVITPTMYIIYHNLLEKAPNIITLYNKRGQTHIHIYM